jgi:23S rRNA (guanine745-N1)-methyltransferase
MWACPHCKEALQLLDAESAWCCSNGHRFDRAREGYVNLLAANRKGSKLPGDSAEMIAARRRVHEAGVYAPLLEGMTGLLGAAPAPAAVLELGCGEGYYCAAVDRLYPAARVQGIDISRAAVRRAAKGHPRVSFAVASSFALPLPDSCQDLVLRIFAPSDQAELLRVLAPGGRYLRVGPAPSHMWELRQALYDEPREHPAAAESHPGLLLQSQSELVYRVELDRALLAAVVAMTPFAWRGHREKRERLLRSTGLSLQMALSLSLFVKA